MIATATPATVAQSCHDPGIEAAVMMMPPTKATRPPMMLMRAPRDMLVLLAAGCRDRGGA
jgi:hypothetical protein